MLYLSLRKHFLDVVGRVGIVEVLSGITDSIDAGLKDKIFEKKRERAGEGKMKENLKEKKK